MKRTPAFAVVACGGVLLCGLFVFTHFVKGDQKRYDAPGNFLRGLDEQRRRDHEQMQIWIQQMRPALHRDPGNAALHAAWASIVDVPKIRLHEYRQAVRLDPGNVSFRCLLADTLHSQGQIGPAIHQYREAVRIQPGQARLHYLLGRALEQSGRRAEACTEWRQVLALHNGDPYWVVGASRALRRSQTSLSQAGITRT